MTECYYHDKELQRIFLLSHLSIAARNLLLPECYSKTDYLDFVLGIHRAGFEGWRLITEVEENTPFLFAINNKNKKPTIYHVNLGVFRPNSSQLRSYLLNHPDPNWRIAHAFPVAVINKGALIFPQFPQIMPPPFSHAFKPTDQVVPISL